VSKNDHNDLASALRALRVESGLTAATVARRAGMSTAKLSKVENGRILPTAVDVERILTALETPGIVRQELMKLARSAVTEQRAWRIYQQLGFHKKQVEIAALEEQSSHIRMFQPAMVPGLLQTAEYVQSIFRGRGGLSDDQRVRTINNRIRRQEAIYDTSKLFEFLICESALRWRTISAAAMATQIDRISSLSLLSNVVVDVIPLAGVKKDFPMTAFCVFDDRLVTVEAFHAEITTRDPKDINVHLDVFNEMRDSALIADGARNFLSDLAVRMRASGE
jgi:transcriptional regulator with XRE-family HTH domain